jgi:cytochrome b561
MLINGVFSSEPHGRAQSEERYDSTTIWLHWLTVALVAILWILGQVTNWLPSGPFRLSVWSTHVVLGVTLAVVLAMRILWRARFGSALPAVDAGVLHWLAKGTHYALYLLLLAVVILGIANTSYMGFDLYGVLTMPRFGNGDPATEGSIDTMHEWAANLLVLTAFFHAAAALGHQYIWRDRLLQRMRPRVQVRLSVPKPVAGR